MPKLSRFSNENVQDIGVGEARERVVEGYEFSFLKLREASDLSGLLKGLPDDLCPCPHWGYVIEGQVTYTFTDHEETFRAGDAFYVPGGHAPAVAAGTEYLMISPEDQVALVNEVLQRNIALATSG